MTVRVRFAPSPTGFMHLGNVRAALFNYLFARQHNGTFILRIEDTDANRNLDEAKTRILDDLEWLTLAYDEGPVKGGPFAPYEQSQCAGIYQEYLDELIESCKVYRCFCSAEELENRRQKQLAMGKPPRYDRTCLRLSDDKIKLKLAAGAKFIWRFKINELQVIEINDMACSTVTFEMKNFGDFAITRHDGSCTFVFANFIDDWRMKVTHVIRGNDHLTNTAQQAALYDAFAVKLPKFWHLPMICNQAGAKLSKRDFGFSLEDLMIAGYIPEAVCNYMATVGVSMVHEIQSLDELIKNFNFNHLHSSGSIKYDIDKLRWFNHKWINLIDIKKLTFYVKPFLIKTIPESSTLEENALEDLLSRVRSEIYTLNEIEKIVGFYFKLPEVTRESIEKILSKDKSDNALSIIDSSLEHIDNTDRFIQELKARAQERGLKIKEVFGPLRYLLTGSFEGIGVHDLLDILGSPEVKKRLNRK